MPSSREQSQGGQPASANPRALHTCPQQPSPTRSSEELLEWGPAPPPPPPRSPLRGSQGRDGLPEPWKSIHPSHGRAHRWASLSHRLRVCTGPRGVDSKTEPSGVILAPTARATRSLPRSSCDPESFGTHQVFLSHLIPWIGSLRF